MLDFRPYLMRHEPIPQEGVQATQEIRKQLLEQDRGMF